MFRYELIHIKAYKRPWLLKRIGGTYEQHAHFYSKKDALEIIKLIKANKHSKNKSERYALKRLLNEKEYNGLNKVPKYKR